MVRLIVICATALLALLVIEVPGATLRRHDASARATVYSPATRGLAAAREIDPSVRVRVAVDNQEQKLRPGLFVRARIALHSALTCVVFQIGREQMRRRLIVELNVRGRDLVGFVKDAQARVAKVTTPPGVQLVWGGQFQNFNRAKDRLLLLVPVSLVTIALMLMMAFGSASLTVVTLLNLPFALGGGILALLFRGLPFSIPAGVGFIALRGVSIMNGVVMTTNLLEQPSALSARDRVREAAERALRPMLSTALVAAIGFIPMALATGPGSEVQRPLATVVIGGGTASAFLL